MLNHYLIFEEIGKDVEEKVLFKVKSYFFQHFKKIPWKVQKSIFDSRVGDKLQDSIDNSGIIDFMIVLISLNDKLVKIWSRLSF